MHSSKDQMAKPRPIDEEQRIPLSCPCGARGTVTLKHWELFRCSKCGRFFWALQPKRPGPFVFFPWPGQHPQ